MNRVQPQKIKEAFEKGPFKPAQSAWARKDEDGKLCEVCGLSILAFDKSQALFNKLIDEDDYFDRSAILESEFNLDKSYISGFLNGFDGETKDYFTWKIDEYDSGFEDGQKAWELVKNM
jgi:hypothetical protein